MSSVFLSLCGFLRKTIRCHPKINSKRRRMSSPQFEPFGRCSGTMRKLSEGNDCLPLQQNCDDNAENISLRDIDRSNVIDQKSIVPNAAEYRPRFNFDFNHRSEDKKMEALEEQIQCLKQNDKLQEEKTNSMQAAIKLLEDEIKSMQTSMKSLTDDLTKRRDNVAKNAMKRK